VSDEREEPFGSDSVDDDRVPAGQPHKVETTGIAWGAVLLLVLIGLIVVFVVQNTATVPVDFLWLSGDFSLALVLLVTIGATIVITEVAGLVYRRRRRRARAEKNRA
jgi:uncharacterized integral membrane protein